MGVPNLRAPLTQLLATISLFTTVFLVILRWRGGETSEHGGKLFNQLSIYRQASGKDPQADFVRHNKYSIIVSTYDRLEHLLQFLDHYGNGDLPNLDAIHIAWGMGAVDPPEELKLDSYRVPVHLERACRNSLTERYKKPKHMRTEAALWLDDDIQIELPGVEFAFRAWQEYGRAQHRIVGLTGRQYTTEKNGKVKYIFHQRDYSMILTNNAFMDLTMLSWFWKEDPRTRAALRYVDQHMNCEDILINFIVSEHNGLAPILVDLAKETYIVDSFGISKQPGHVHQRTLCMQKFVELYGMPLKSSDTAIVRSPVDGKQLVPLAQAFKSKGRPWGKNKAFKFAQ